MQLPDAHVRHRILRIPTGKAIPTNLSQKRFMTPDQVDLLLDGEVIVEEKLDGKQISKVFPVTMAEWHGKYTETPRMIMYGEYLKYTHSIPYRRLPSWFVAWDFYMPDSKRFIHYEMREAICKFHGIAMPPLIWRGNVTKKDLLLFMDRISSYANEIQEGIVVKNYKHQLFGKIVRKEFITGIELKGHWLRAKGQAKMNRLEVSRHN